MAFQNDAYFDGSSICLFYIHIVLVNNQFWCFDIFFHRELLSKEREYLFWDFTEYWLLAENADFDSYTAKDCLKRIVNYGKSVLSEPLASVFEFSLTLRSASPRLVLYRQLAEDSLSSFPLVDDSSLNPVNEDLSEPTDIIKSKKNEPLVAGPNPRVPNGKCCWVDIGSAIFFDAIELQQWLQSPSKL